MNDSFDEGPLFEKVAIIGTGLIGGSIGMALVGRNLARQVVGVDLKGENLELAVETKAVHWGTTDLAQGVKGAQLVIIAVPVGLTIEILERIIPFLSPGTIVTDVGSTKAAVVSAAENLIPENIYFIGGHPMAGSEQAGIRGADRYLLENAVYLLTPTAKTKSEALAKIMEMVEKIGSKVIQMDPSEHDLEVAAVSHLPHLMAVALVNTVGKIQESHPQTLFLAAGGFRDVTRIASSHPVMWRDICLTNQAMLLAVIRDFRGVLAEMEQEIINGNGEELQLQLEKARNLRCAIPAKMKGYLPVLHEIVVTIPDRPGMIAEVAEILGRNGINIVDIEILRVREGEGGSLRVGLDSEANLATALDVLNGQGIVAKSR